MECFVDLDVQRNPEIPMWVVLNGLYECLHRALAPDNSAGIAVAFPGYSSTSLGRTMRLMGGRMELQGLIESEWLGGIRDYVRIGPVLEIPLNARHRALRRVQAKSSPERLRRRLSKRHGLDESQARTRIPDDAIEKVRLPFVQLRSRTTRQTFPLFLRLGPDEPAPVEGAFNAYGLSQVATIPWF